MAHWQKNYRETNVNGVTTITHEGDRQERGGRVRTLLHDYEPVAGCVVCAHPDRLAIDGELDDDAAMGMQEPGRIARLWHGDFTAGEVLDHLRHRTPPTPSANVKAYFETERYRAAHPEAPEEPAVEPAPLITVFAPERLTGPDGDGRAYVLWERDPSHPGGEATVISDGQPVVVARTPAVKRLLERGELVEAKAVTS